MNVSVFVKTYVLCLLAESASTCRVLGTRSANPNLPSMRARAGVLPSTWAKMPALRVLLIQRTQINGSVLDSYGTMSQLTYMDLALNRLSGMPTMEGCRDGLQWLISVFPFVHPCASVTHSGCSATVP